MAKLRIDGEALATVMSNCGSPMSSWMSDLSMGSEAEQSLHSFSQSQSQQGEALAEPDLGPGICFAEEVTGGSSPRRGSLEGEVLLSENGSDKGTPTKDRLRKLPPSMAKTNIQILAGASSFSSFKTTSVHPCGIVKPMVIQEPTILSSPTKTSLLKDPSKLNAQLLASISSEMSFEDPWLKRGIEEGRSRELVCEVKPARKEVEHAKSQAGDGTGDHQSFSRSGKQASHYAIKTNHIHKLQGVLYLCWSSLPTV